MGFIYIKLKRNLCQSKCVNAMSAQIGMIMSKVESLDKWISKMLWVPQKNI